MGGVNLIQDGTAETKKPPIEAVFFCPWDLKMCGVTALKTPSNLITCPVLKPLKTGVLLNKSGCQSGSTCVAYQRLKTGLGGSVNK